EGPVKPGHNLTFSCNGQGLILKGQREITCQPNGEWSSPFPKCERKDIQMRTACGPPPHQENADTEEMPKNEYSYGEKVKYMCYNKFTMEGYPYLTCGHSPVFVCLNPCMVTVEEMDKRGIELKWGERQKIFSPHKDTISFACQKGKYLKDGTDLRQTCTNGVMLLPRCA
uniref:Complement factor H like 5 n=1 Tax=Cyprinus carpio TaxID=7962 RepID=A0A8C1ZH99_CYPCA